MSVVLLIFCFGPCAKKCFVDPDQGSVISSLHCDVGGDGGDLCPLVGDGPGAELPHAGGGAVQLGALLLVRQHPPGRDRNNNNKLTHPPQRWSNYAPI